MAAAAIWNTIPTAGQGAPISAADAATIAENVEIIHLSYSHAPEKFRTNFNVNLSQGALNVTAQVIDQCAALPTPVTFTNYASPNPNLANARYQQILVLGAMIMVPMEWMSFKALSSGLNTQPDKVLLEATYELMGEFWRVCTTDFQNQIDAAGAARAPGGGTLPANWTMMVNAGPPVAVFTDLAIHQGFQRDITKIRHGAKTVTDASKETNSSIPTVASGVLVKKAWITQCMEDPSKLNDPKYLHYLRLLALLSQKTRCPMSSIPDPDLSPNLVDLYYTVLGPYPLMTYLCIHMIQAIRKGAALTEEELYQKAVALGGRIRDILYEKGAKRFTIRSGIQPHAKVAGEFFVETFNLAAASVVEEILDDRFMNEGEQLLPMGYYYGGVTTSLATFVKEVSDLTFNEATSFAESWADGGVLRFFASARDNTIECITPARPESERPKNKRRTESEKPESG